MSFIVQIYNNDQIHNIDLLSVENASIGSGKKDTVNLDVIGLKKRHIVFKKMQDGFLIKSKGQLMVGSKSIVSNQISVGDKYNLLVNSIIIVIYPKQSDSKDTIDLNKVNEVIVGRSELNDVVLNNKRTSSKHCKIYKTGDTFRVADCNSRNGTYLNGKRIKDEIISDNDVINISIYSILFSEGKLSFKNTGSDMTINLDNSLRRERSSKEYPYFQRSPRLISETLPSDFEIVPPPGKGQKPQMNWLSILLPPIVTIGVMIIYSRMSGDNNTSSLIYTVPTTLVSVFLAITSYTSQKRKHKKMDILRNNKYLEYLKNIEDDFKVKMELQRNELNEKHPSIEECTRIVFNIERRLWDRMPSDFDFMSLRLGKGERDFNVNIHVPKRGIELMEDDLLNEPEKIQKKFRIVKNVPITIPLTKSCTVGVVGDRLSILRIVQNLVVQAVTHHSYDEVKIVTLFSQEEKEKWQWIRWMPHSWDNNKNLRYMAMDKENAGLLLKELEELIKERKKIIKESKDSSLCLPYFLFLIADKDLVEGQTILKLLNENNQTLGIGTLFLYDTMNNLPKNCNVIIDCKNKKGEIFLRGNAANKTSFVFDDINEIELDRFARASAPIKVKIDALDSKLPNCVTFLEGYGVKKPEEIDLAKNWSSGLTYKSMAVPIGVKSNGDTFCFDIWEKAHGPFGQVAGMPGSGKSEMVQTWILSMAVNFSPSDVSFILIDFKGTGLILPFTNMPHLAGTISDIDTNIHRNLIALENELKRRKELFNSQGVQNITDYLKLLKSGAATEPLSIMIIIVDEFAEMKIQFPDFMPVIDSIFAIGRSLGVYCILMSQKPTGVVSDKVEANTKFRWCLRVASASESREMIGYPEASKITVPGRGYIKVGDDEVFEHIQSYWSGAPYNPNKTVKATVSHQISFIEMDGRRVFYKKKEKAVTNNSVENEIDAVVNYIADYTDSNKILKARKIWAPKLPGDIYLDKIFPMRFADGKWEQEDIKISVVIGMIDNPYTQSQYPLNFNFTEDGHHIIYGSPGSGKTTMLQTVTMSLISKYSPEDVNIYIMDFGGWSMGIFNGFPHVGGIVNDNDSECIEKMVRMITKELEVRRQKFAEQSVGNISSYKTATNEKLSSIFIIIDNFEPLKNVYSELEDFFVNTTREGGNYGIYIITCGNNTNAVWYKMSSNIKASFVLQMTDKSEYSSIVGKTEGLEPEKLVGRGLLKSSPSALEFQTALPVYGESEVERAKKVKELAKHMAETWKGKKAKPIPVMPEIINFGTVDGNDIVIGLTTADVDPLEINFENSHYILVSGQVSSGKSNLLKVVIKQFAGKVIAFDSTNSELKSIEKDCEEFVTEVERFDEIVASMVAVLEERKEELNADNTKKFDPYLIVIDDLKECFDLIHDDTVKILYQITRLGKGLNVNLLVAGNCDEISSLYNQGESFTSGLINAPISILIGGTFGKHDVFSVTNLSYADQDIKLEEHEAYILNKEVAIKFKLMYEK